MTTTERTTVVGVFTERAQAERAIEDLRNARFNENQIGFLGRGEDTSAPTAPRVVAPVMPVSPMGGAVVGSASVTPGFAPVFTDDESASADDVEHESDSVAGAATGAVGGGVIGGLVGAAAALLIPGVGIAVAGGILAATLGGVAIGAVAGGFIGALTGMGIPESDAHYYQDELSTGRSIITVNSPDRYDEALSILRSNGAYDASTHLNDPITSTHHDVPPMSPPSQQATGQYTHTIDPTVAASPSGLNPDTFTVAPAPQVDMMDGTTAEPHPYNPDEHLDRADRPEYNPNISGNTNQ